MSEDGGIEGEQSQKNKVEPWSQLGGVVGEKIKGVIKKVEDPEDREAKATFGRHLTQEEQQKQKFLGGILERGWWILVLVVVALILWWNWPVISNFYCLLTNCQKEELVVATPVASPTSVVVASIFSGHASMINEDMGWLRNEMFSSVYYYEAGRVVTGNYQGATRYFVATQRRRDRVFRIYELWRLADGEVLLNGKKSNVRAWLQNMQDYYLGQYFIDRVRWQDEFVDDFPQTITLSPTMLLYRREVLTDLGPYDGAYYGEPRLELSLLPSEYTRLQPLAASNYKDLSFYTKSYTNEEFISQVAPNLDERQKEIMRIYVDGGTKVVVTDSTGVSEVYELVFADQWENYRRTNLNRDLQSLEFYRQDLARYVATTAFGEYKTRLLAGEYGELPAGTPVVPSVELGLPGYLFQTQQFSYTDERSRWVNFVSGFTSVCDRMIDGKVIKAVNKDELVQIGRINTLQVPLYRLVDVHHPLNQLAYDMKVAQQNMGVEVYKSANFDVLVQIKGYNRSEIERIKRGSLELGLPTFEEYVETNPLLIIFDPWERPILVWEADIEFLSDCVTIEESSTL